MSVRVEREPRAAACPILELEKIRKLAAPWRDGGVYASYKPPPREVAAGKWTGVHREIGAWLADHPSVGIIVHHEPEGGEDRLDGATFEATFGRARDEIKAGWSGARVAYCAMAYQWRPGGLAAKHPDHWRRVVADEYLCDVYSGMNERNGAFPTELILPEHPGYVGWFKEIVRPHLAWNSIGREKERARLLHHDSPAAMRELTTDFAERVQ